jgi:multidrug efflux pump subunit AcrA (membrane-fusion protein)
VDKDNVVQSRSVQTGQIEGTLRVIEGGLKPDDQVVITGLSRAVPGEKVTAKLVPMPES